MRLAHRCSQHLVCSYRQPSLPLILKCLALAATHMLQDRAPGSDDARNRPWFKTAEKRHWYHINLNMDDIFVQPPSNQGPDTDRQWFLQQVKDAVANSETKELVLYIHGYNNSFEDAVKTAAQLVVDTANLVTNGPSVTYGPRAVVALDWASCHSTKHYATDLVRARAAGPKLAELLYHLGGAVSALAVSHWQGMPAAVHCCILC